MELYKVVLAQYFNLCCPKLKFKVNLAFICDFFLFISFGRGEINGKIMSVQKTLMFHTYFENICIGYRAEGS